MISSAFNDLLLPALSARFVLLANHVLASAPAATQRLVAHSGKSVQLDVEGWSLPVLPAPPSLLLKITPAGLFEVPEAGQLPTAPDLRLALDTSQPLENAKRLAAGEVPAVRIEGDAALAADMSWLLANVRWDITADLQKVFGPVAAEGFSRAAQTATDTVKQMMQAVAGVVRKP